MADFGEVSAGTVTIDGTLFAAFTSTGVAAGSIYEERVYRVLRDDRCFEIVELLHSGNIDNYQPSEILEFDRAKFQRYLEAIDMTFSFTSQ